MPRHISELIAAHPDDAPALGAPDRPWLSYGGLRTLSRSVREGLAAWGISSDDRVAIVLPNGPEMAAAFITVAQAAITAPLNPGYRREEFAFYLSDLGAKAVIVPDCYTGPALEAGGELGLSIIRLHPGEAAGAFHLSAPASARPAPVRRVHGAQDVGLILHTSGTTSRPKIVPLTHANICASAQNIMHTLALSPKDRCLNIMPLFHIHGLVAAVAASLAAGASIWCSPGFDALRFFGWMDASRPTWYTAVPTMHQAILARAARNTETIGRIPLRFIRSSSASLPPQVMIALSETFNSPVIESYGMTEAAHQMTSNPLPPRPQKPGSVGLAAGPDVRVAHEAENRLVTEPGEVVISGPNVTPSYENNPMANEKSFFDAEGKRWFRTGDLGSFDADGYLTLSGRLKEIINRGGEKVSPLEVDAVLMDHPAVQQVVTFGIPHDKLGEEVGVAIVLREGMSVSETDIRSFAESRLATFKVPRRILILEEIPKGATGKLQRIGLAQKLGLT